MRSKRPQAEKVAHWQRAISPKDKEERNRHEGDVDLLWRHCTPAGAFRSARRDVGHSLADSARTGRLLSGRRGAGEPRCVAPQVAA